MARPRKYATAAEAAHARKLQERERKRRSRAPEHAKKADPAKRKDAFVNAMNWPAAPINDETMAFIASILKEAGELSNFSVGLPAPTQVCRRCAALVRDWESANRQRLPYLQSYGPPQAWTYTLQGVSGPVRSTYWMTAAERWNRFYSILQLTIRLFLEREAKSLRRNAARNAKDATSAEAAGITVNQLRNQREAVAVGKWKRKQEATALREKGERLLAHREQQEAAKLAEHASYGRF